MDLQPLLAPKSVALIGASNKDGSLGHDMIKMIIKSGYKGEIYPINPRYEEVCGIKCYESLEAIGSPVDCVVLSVAAKRVLEQIETVVKNKGRSIVIFPNCVIEDDPGLEDKIVEACKKANIPVLGHNAMGYYNNDLDLRICGFDAPDEGMKGNIALVSQSGSVFSTLGHNEPQLKYNFLLATGTGQITSLEDVMMYVLDMPTTKVLGVYMESIRKPKRLLEVFEYAQEKRIPVVLMKVARSALGAEFALSHTGGLAGDDDAFQAVLDHYGVIRCDSFTEMANTLLMFSMNGTDIPKGGVVAIADSGGERNLLADDAEFVGLEYAKLSDKTMKELQELQEYGQHASNPLDPWGTGIDFDKIFEASMIKMLCDDNAAIGLMSQDLRDGYYLSQGCIDALKGAKKATGKPVAFMTNFSGIRRVHMTEQINSFGAPVLSDTRSGLKAIKNYLAYRDFCFKEDKATELALSDESINMLKNQSIFQESDSLKILKELGISVLDSFCIEDKKDLYEYKHCFKYPVVLKTAVKGILHKEDVGGVMLNINDFENLEAKYDDMSKRLGKSAIIVEMKKYDVELIFGMKTDPNFGPLIIVGAGGIYTELLKDTIIMLPNSTEQEIGNKLKTLKTYKLLTGFRHSQPCDIDKLISQIKNFCNICYTLGSYVKEIDINPVVIKGSEIIALDALIIK